MMIERRSLITGLVALVAAPAIVKASSLMVCAPTETLRTWGNEYWEYNPLRDEWTQYGRNDLLTIDEITRESVNLFRNENIFLSELHKQQWTDDFMVANSEQFEVAKVGDVVRIRLPNDYVVNNSPVLDALSHPADAFAYAMKGEDRRVLQHLKPLPQIAAPLAVAALAVAAAPVVEQALQKPVTRRFWSR